MPARQPHPPSQLALAMNPAHYPPYESGQVWTSNSMRPPATGWEPGDIIIRDAPWLPPVLFMWSKPATEPETNELLERVIDLLNQAPPSSIVDPEELIRLFPDTEEE